MNNMRLSDPPQHGKGAKTAVLLGRGTLLSGLIVLLLLGFVLRLHGIGAQSLWHDEGNTYVQTTRTLAEIADHASRDIHPPLYYWLIAIWTQFLGASEFGLRSLSLFASLLTIALTYALGVRLFGRVPALLATLFVALNTFSIYYAQEARMYALLALLGVMSMWAFARFMPVGTQYIASSHTDGIYAVPTRWGMALAIINAIGLYTHYAYPLVMLAQATLFVLWISAEALMVYRQKARASNIIRQTATYIAINLFTIMLFLPLLPTALTQLGGWGQAEALLSPHVALGKILAYVSVGITLGTGLSISIVFFMLFALIRLADEPRRTWWRVAFPVVWGAISVGIFLGFGLYREANLKFLLPIQVAVALWMGRGVWSLWMLKPRNGGRNSEWIPKLATGVGLLSIISVMVAGIGRLYADPEFLRDDYRAIVHHIQTEARDGDAIVLSAPNQAEVFHYYYVGNLPVYELPRGLGGDDEATYAEITRLIAQHPRLFAVFWAQSERDPNNIVEGTLDTQAYEADADWYGGVRLVRYIAPITFEQFIPVDVQFGEHIRLLQYAMSSDVLVAGDVLQVQLQWQTDAPLSERYKVFVQLLDEMGQVVIQRDAEPSAWNRPTTTWEVGETINDQHALIIPNDLPLAHYTLIIGLYNADEPSARLQVERADYFILAKFALQ